MHCHWNLVCVRLAIKINSRGFIVLTAVWLL